MLQPRVRRVASALLAWVVLAGCSGKGCASSKPVRVVVDAGHLAPVAARVNREQCSRELEHASVGVPAGMGPMEAITASCRVDADGTGSLSVYTVRGNTLGRLVRALEPGQSFTAPEIITTGATEPGVMGEGTLVWRSPTLLDEVASDQWWAATLPDRAAPLGDGTSIRMGTVLFPEGWGAAGLIVPLGVTQDGVEVLSSMGNATPGQETNPSLIRTVISFDDRDSPDASTRTLPRIPPILFEGELRAWESTQHVALLYTQSMEGRAELVALQVGAGGTQTWGRVPLKGHDVRVVAQGVARDGEVVFVASEFAYVSGSPNDDCIILGSARCVQTQTLTLLRFAKDRPAKTLELARHGLGDGVGVDHAGRVWVMFVGADGRGPLPGVQKIVRADPANGLVEPLVLTAGDALPPFDRPVLVQCGNDPWFVAEVRVDGETTSSRDDVIAPRDTAILAAPLECLSLH